MWTDMLEEVKKIPALVSDKGVEVQQTAHTRWIEARGKTRSVGTSSRSPRWSAQVFGWTTHRRGRSWVLS